MGALGAPPKGKTRPGEFLDDVGVETLGHGSGYGHGFARSVPVDGGNLILVRLLDELGGVHVVRHDQLGREFSHEFLESVDRGRLDVKADNVALTNLDTGLAVPHSFDGKGAFAHGEALPGRGSYDHPHVVRADQDATRAVTDQSWAIRGA